jgi:hypothetical protein
LRLPRVLELAGDHAKVALNAPCGFAAESYLFPVYGNKSSFELAEKGAAPLDFACNDLAKVFHDYGHAPVNNLRS